MTSLGTHNLLDGAAPATDFADIIFFTESLPEVVRAIGHTHIVFVCPQQKDLAIAVHWSQNFTKAPGKYYDKAVFGVAKVSPNRGTFVLTDDVAKVALIVEHRINAAFPPFKRGEALFRKLAWWSHTRMTLKTIRRLKKRGYTVHAGGDLNTPVGVSGYRGVLNEVGRKYDRLGSTKPLVNAKRLPALGSDHFRLRAEVE